MGRFFFSGSYTTKLDEKNRFVLPQSFRLGLVENGQLNFTLALGMRGCLAIYRKSEIDKIVESFEKQEYSSQHSKFFTVFFSTLYHASFDKLGRVSLPPSLKKAVGIDQEIVIAGVLNKIEIWPKAHYENDLQDYLKNHCQTEKGLEAYSLLLDPQALKETPKSFLDHVLKESS